jgi:hypothetical protein
MTRDEILAADEAGLKDAILATLEEDWAACAITHADLLDECEGRWGVLISVHPFMSWDGATGGKPRTLWDANARDGEALHGLIVEGTRAPTRRLAELRALALALHEKGVLA